MGRILTPPKPKKSSASPQVIYYAPAPVTPTPTNPATSDSDANTPTPEKTEAEVASERAENILRRNRSRLGTILTSFKGVLSNGSASAARKTLLGE